MLTLKKLSRAAWPLAGLAVLSGCATSPLPLAANFATTTQMKVRSAGHWQALSQDVVKKTLASLGKNGVQAPLFVAPTPEASAFDRAFNGFLVTELVNSGAKVQTAPEGALRVSYSTQVVNHASKRPNFIPAQYTMLVAGLYVLGGVAVDSALGAGAATLAAAGGLDYHASVNAGGPTHTEMILTTTIANGVEVLTRTTDVYYVEEADATLFAKMLPKPPITYTVMEMKVAK